MDICGDVSDRAIIISGEIKQRGRNVKSSADRVGGIAKRVDVTCTGTFAVAGAPPAAIPGQVTITGPDVEVVVREARFQLVATPRG